MTLTKPRPIAVLLHQVEGPINLGAICRMMANTGFGELRFTGPLTRDEEMARRFAVHAVDLLEGAKPCRDFATLIGGIDCLFGFSPRTPWSDGRNINLDQFHTELEKAKSLGKRIGLLFGNEARGLENAHLAQCHHRVTLPTSQQYRSMNLAQAVTVVLWELARRGNTAQRVDPIQETPMARAEEIDSLIQNLRQFLDTIEFLDPQNPDHLWLEIMPMFKTRDWTRRELTLLHAIFGKGRSRYLASLRRARAKAGLEADIPLSEQNPEM